MTVAEDLGKLGTLQGAAFSQSRFRTHDTVEGADLTGGYCAGVTLDWCRRTLLSRHDRGATSLGYGKENYDEPGTDGRMSRQEATVRRMATAYREQGATYASETNLQKAKAFLPNLLLRPEQNLSGFTKGVPLTKEEATVISKLWALPENEINFRYAVPGSLPHTRIRSLIEAARTKQDPQHRAQDAQGRGWDNMATLMDERFSAIRVAEGRQVSNKPFSGIRVRRSSPVESFGSAGQWAAKLRTEGYELGCCTLVTLAPGSGGSGHAVAVHRREADSYGFFDPNYGTYRMTQQSLQNCFQHLFWSPYFQAEANTLDGRLAVYRRRDTPDGRPDAEWTKMGYTIFERAAG